MNDFLQPADWVRPKGYSDGMSARGRMVFVAGQIGCDKFRRIVSSDFVTQARKALSNIVDVLSAGGAKPEHIVRLTWYVTDIEQYRLGLDALGIVYRDIIGRHFPAMTLVQVSSLVDPKALLEIEATAVVPEEA